MTKFLCEQSQLEELMQTLAQATKRIQELEQRQSATLDALVELELFVAHKNILDTSDSNVEYRDGDEYQAFLSSTYLRALFQGIDDPIRIQNRIRHLIEAIGLGVDEHNTRYLNQYWDRVIHRYHISSETSNMMPDWRTVVENVFTIPPEHFAVYVNPTRLAALISVKGRINVDFKPWLTDFIKSQPGIKLIDIRREIDKHHNPDD